MMMNICILGSLHNRNAATDFSIQMSMILAAEAVSKSPHALRKAFLILRALRHQACSLAVEVFHDEAGPF